MESITASVPSSTALATSEASARLGRGLWIIESSIWVAVMTGLPAALQAAIMAFCAIGTSSGLVSTPRSPRATMQPSETATMSRIASTASRRSIFEISLARLPWAARYSRIISTSEGSCTKLAATKSTPCSMPKSRSSLSFGVTTSTFIFTPGKFTPLLGLSGPPTTTSQRRPAAVTSSTFISRRPSSNRIVAPAGMSFSRFS
ncbi:hypothetical protein D3C72_600530 [compost metagenome]